MTVSHSERGGAATERAWYVLRRLIREGRANLAAAWATLGCLVAETIIDTAIMPVLLALVFLTITPGNITQPPKPAGPAQAVRAPQSQAQATPGDKDIKGETQAQVAAQLSKSQQLLDRIGWHLENTVRARLRALGLFISLAILAILLKCLFGIGRGYLAELFAQGLIRNLRERLYVHLMRQSLTFHKARPTGDLLSRVTGDVAVLQRVLSADLVNAASAPITIAIALSIMCFFSPKLTLVALVFVPVIAVIIARSGDRLRRLAREVQRRLGQLNAFLQERLAGVETVQLFGREEAEAVVFEEINQSNYRANMRVARVMAMLSPLIEFISMAGMFVLIYVAGYLAIRGPLAIGELLAFGYVSQRLGSKLGLLGKIWLSGQQAAAAGDRVFEILDADQEVPELPNAGKLPRVRGEIAFRQVVFRYGQGEEVLRGVEVCIEAGQSVALVGASGAGKTSLVNLIPRFYEPSAGRIEIDGVNIATVTLSSLRSQIGIVPQDPILFSGSAHENIAYGRPEATEEDIEKAARAAHADEFIRELPEGYDTPVGERATKLSGGQKQRIAIARTLLRDPRVLILDEATSALDAESEALVQDAMDKIMVGRTTIIIAHRLSTIQRVDRILVLAEGVIAEDGTHEQLLRHGGLYRRLYETQLQGLNGEGTLRP